MYVLQNTAVALSAGAALGASLAEPRSGLFWTCTALVIAIGSASSVGCQGSALSVEREWTKTLCNGNSAALAKLNAGTAWPQQLCHAHVSMTHLQHNRISCLLVTS